ncbi:MAG TPA: Crp/Fnr family transcriptional regulator [Pyrinomonadaceae bacterium]|nr:Crp/Fnr family transcriptional regulator [Pyrinomonadaceae bacterium]
MSPRKTPRIANQLLAALPDKDYQELQRHMEEIPLVLEQYLYQANVVISDVYFPNSGIVSLLAGVDERSTLEVGLVGNEGMVGLSVFMGVNSSVNYAVVQGAGLAMKMNATAFRRECNKGGVLPQLLARYAHSMLTQVAQCAVCNQFHSMDSRLSRWLLMTQDRMGTDEFQLTQEFLSNMLGVRREGVNKAAGELQKQGLISYQRGHLKVLDRPGLEAISCQCYEIIRNEAAGSQIRN